MKREQEALRILDTESLEEVQLGTPEWITTIPTYEGIEGFWRFSKEIAYPPNMVEALSIILDKYTTSFDEVVRRRQGEDGYIHAKDSNGRYVNFGFQIDLAPPSFSELSMIQDLDPHNLAEILEGRIFEIENSLAMYNMMRGLFSKGETYSTNNFFGVNFDVALERWRDYHGKPIILGAVTEDKYYAMLTSEFGITNPKDLTRKRVHQLSGFDSFLGPQQLQRLTEKGILENTLLYMRTSYPTTWQKKPQKWSIPLLENDEYRRRIRRQTITFNVDDPRGVNLLLENLPSSTIEYTEREGFRLRRYETIFSPGIVNDTKEALVRMGLGYPLPNYEAICLTEEYRNERRKLCKRRVCSQEFKEFLQLRGFSDPENTIVRAKPLWLHYGGYGHVRGKPTERKFTSELRGGLRTRGPYIAQPEIPPNLIENLNDRRVYAVIHRLFFAFDPFTQKFKFIGGLLNALPAEGNEVKRGRIHGNKEAVWGQIVTSDSNLVVTSESLNYIESGIW